MPGFSTGLLNFAPLDASLSSPGPSPSPPASPQALNHARWATRLQFGVLGGLAGAWGAHIPSVKQHFALTEGRLALVLLAAGIGAILALGVAGRVVARLGARRTVQAAGLAMSLALAGFLQLDSLAMVWPLALVFGLGMSLFDVAINTEGSELEHQGGRALMSNLHALFSIGGMLGAGCVALLLRAGVAPPHQLAAIGAVLAVAAVWGSRGMLAVHPVAPGAAGQGEAAHFAWPRGLLLVLGLLVLAGMIAEGVMYDWCVLYLQQELGLSAARAAWGYAAFSGAMALARFGGDALRERFAERRLLAVGAGTAAAAMTVVLLSASPAVAFVGFMLVGAGLAPVAPVLFNAATRVPGVSRAAAIAAVTSIGYSGFLIGPPLIGALAQAATLTAALSVVVVGASLLALGARWVPGRASA